MNGVGSSLVEGSNPRASLLSGSKRPRSEDEDDAQYANARNIEHKEEAEAGLTQFEIQEQLRDVMLDEATESAVISVVERIALLLKGQPSSVVDSSNISGLLKDFSFPEERPFTFHAPEKVTVIGSFALGASVLPEAVADVGVLVPSSCFDEKDYLNHRYMAKRALYLCHIARILKERRSELQVKEIGWGGVSWDARRPFLTVQLSETKDVSLRILPVISMGMFPIRKLAPDRNCLRSAAMPQTPQVGGSQNDGVAKQLLPTPNYNRGIVEDMMMLEHSSIVLEVARQSPHFKDASVLLRIWARQNHVSSGSDGVSNFLLTMMLCHLIISGKIVSFIFQISPPPFCQMYLGAFVLHAVMSDWQDESLLVYSLVFIEKLGRYTLALKQTEALTMTRTNSMRCIMSLTHIAVRKFVSIG